MWETDSTLTVKTLRKCLKLVQCWQYWQYNNRHNLFRVNNRDAKLVCEGYSALKQKQATDVAMYL